MFNAVRLSENGDWCISHISCWFLGLLIWLNWQVMIRGNMSL